MACTPKRIRKRGRFSYTVSCIMPKGELPLWFKDRCGGIKNSRYTKTFRKAGKVANSLFHRGAEEVFIVDLRLRREYSYR